MYKIPTYINKPLTYVGLELIDVVLIYAAGFYSYVVESGLYLLISMTIVIWFIRKKKNSPQGYCKHLLYYVALYNPDIYPEYKQQEFLE